MPNASMLFLAVVVALLQSSCAFQRGSYYWWSDNNLSAHQIDAILREHPMEPSQNISVTPLASTASGSHHLVQVRHSESLHVHRDHDLAVFVYRGQGRIRIGQQVISIHQGDMLSIPRGVPHAFENTASKPSVAIVIFTPPFDGKDTVQK